MVRKKLAMAVLALSALQADLASALGLGNLSVKSALNQPLNAEIKLLDTGDLDPSQIKVQLAAPEDFERAGVDRNFFLTNLKFAVDIDGRGTGTIRITTRDAVVEPYLNFVVEAKWPNGRLLREFAVLLDPPTFSGGAAQPVARPAPAPRAATPAPAAPPRAAERQLEPPKVSTAPAPSAAERLESNTLPDASSATEHRVQAGDTLSKIAAQHKPADASVQQTMVAIQRANPDAFINSNINLIKSGSVLRLPNAEEARGVSSGDAAEQIAAQTHAWRSGGAGETASGPQLDASQPQSADAGGAQDKERLTIATPGSSDKSTVGEGTGKGSKSLDALRNQLSASQESLDSAKRDNKELQSRLDDMERQVATLQRLISLKDDQLAALQAKSAEQGKAAAPAQPAPATAPGTQPPATSAPAAEQPAPAVQTAQVPAPVTPPAPAKPPVTKAPAKKAPAPAPEPTFLDKLTSEPLYWGGALAALALLLGGAMVAKKRREREEEESAAYQELDLADYAEESEASPEVDRDNATISDEAIVPTYAAAAAAAVVEPETKPLRSETGDAIAEADIYIAYGRYQQAVDLLTSAIDAEPSRADLRVKLLEVFLEMRDREAFRQQFMALQSLGDGQAIGQVKEMLSSVEGVSDWLDDLPQPHSPNAGYAAAGFAAGAAAAVVADELRDDTPIHDELDLDLDLDDEAPIAEAATFEPAPQPFGGLPAEPLEDLALDLDLNDDLGDGLDLPHASAAAPAFDHVESESGFDPFASPANSEAADFELELDEDELDLDLNEEDLDFALRAMEGDKAEGLDPADSEPFAPTPTFEEPAFVSDSFVQETIAADFDAPAAADETLSLDDDFDLPDFGEPLVDQPLESPSSIETPIASHSDFAAPDFETALDEPFESPVATAPVFERAAFEEPAFEQPAPAPAFDAPSFDETTESFSLDEELGSFDEPVANAASDGLKEFDLSLTDEALSAAETSKMEEDLGDLSELEDLGDFSFENEPAAPAFTPAAEPVAVPDLTQAVGDDFDFLADTDEVATKLDLARAYIDMGDTDGAKDILDEVMTEGSDVQKQEASELLGRIA